MNKAQQRMVRVRSHLLQDQPWWGARAMHLKLEPSDEFPIGATNGNTLFYNPGWVQSQPEWAVRFFVAHEVDHCALGHPWRRKDRDMKEWNIATDYAINLGLRDAGFQVPSGVYLDEQFRGWSADAIYAYRQNQNMLQQPQPNPQTGAGTEQPQNQGNPQEENDPKNGLQRAQDQPQGGKPSQGQENAPGAATEPKNEDSGDLQGTNGQPCPTGQILDAPQNEENAEQGMSQADWQIASEQAMRVALKAGKLPGGVQTMMEGQIRETTTDWTALLREFFQKLSPVNYSWTRPSRRAQNMILPGTVREELGQIVWAVDTSGSIGHHIYQAFASEFGTLMAEVQPKQVLFVQCDAAVQSVEEFTPGDEVRINRCGYGGTRFTPVFDWVEQEGHQPAALIYLTDLECCDRPQEPDYPVLWVTPEWIQQEGPFGRTVRIHI